MKPNQIAAAIAAIINSVDWKKLSAILQLIIKAANQGRLGPWLTNALLKQEWNNERFIIRDHFKVNIDSSGQVKISFLGEDWKEWFLAGTEGYDRARKLSGIILEKEVCDCDIICNNGGVQNSISSHQDIWAMMEAQPNGPKSNAGPLLTNGWSNIFYIPQSVTWLSDNSFSYLNGLTAQVDVEEIEDRQYLFLVKGQWYVLRAVRVQWVDDGWDVRARSILEPHTCYVDEKVFFRKVPKSSKP